MTRFSAEVLDKSYEVDNGDQEEEKVASVDRSIKDNFFWKWKINGVKVIIIKKRQLIIPSHENLNMVFVLYQMSSPALKSIITEMAH